MKFHKDGTLPDENQIFVFGSNLAGIHGLGSALIAKEKYGAKYGIGKGLQGKSYAIPTKDGRDKSIKLSDPKSTLPLEIIKKEINVFINYAKNHPEEEFFVVRVGCQLATHKDKDIAPLFKGSPHNCSFAKEWQSFVERDFTPNLKDISNTKDEVITGNYQAEW